MKNAIKALVIGDYDVIHTSRPEAEILVGLALSGLDITVMTKEGTEYTRRLEEHGVRVIPFQPQHKFKRAESQFIRQELINGRYDILQLYTSKAIVNGVRAARRLPVKVVLYRGYAGHIHWYDPAAYLKYLHPRVDMIVCNSVGVEAHFRRQLFFDKSKLITINKGHDPAWYADVTPVERKSIGVPDGAFLVACMANVRPMKGIRYLLEAMHSIPADIPIHLVIAGRDSDTEEFRKIVANAPAPPHIHLMGYRDDALQIVAASDVFALASIKGESITRAVQEAMALGKVPVITNIPGNTELVEHEVSGLVVPAKHPKAIADALLKLYHDRALCQKLAEGARRHIATRLSHKRTVEKMKELYERLASQT